MTKCTCGSQKDYLNCCGLLLEEENLAQSPEALMRSRYTAYTKARMDYIKKTMRGKPLEGFNETSVGAWASQVKWTGLEVLTSYYDEQDENIGYVEFIARFQEKGKEEKIHELSKFERIEGQWFYVSGIMPKSKAPKKAPISRNAPCHCGSQKKYKNCHGKY